MVINIDPKAKALIFDLDGTLSNSLPVHVASWKEVGNKVGFNFDEKIIYELTGRPTIEFAKKIVNDHQLSADPEELVRLKQESFREMGHKIEAVKEVMAIVKAYKGKLPMAVGTGASKKSAVMQLTTLDVIDIFDAIVSADDVENHKPDPDTFLRCASIMKIKPEECQVFEDGDLGIQAAIKAGMMVTDVRQYIDYGNWQ